MIRSMRMTNLNGKLTASLNEGSLLTISYQLPKS